VSYYVKITRVADTSAEHELGHPSRVGSVRYSRTFSTRTAASREADAWAARGEFARYAPSDFDAEVLDGPSPPKR